MSCATWALIVSYPIGAPGTQTRSQLLRFELLVLLALTAPFIALGALFRRTIWGLHLDAAFAMFACYYNYCWQTRKPGKSGQKRPTVAMMAGLAGHVWSFDELFDEVLKTHE